jgi:pyruvate ferredoxin oxidoreductase beta subunit
MTEKAAIVPTGLLRQMPMTEYLAPGHRACPGCAEVLALKLLLRVLGPDIIVVMATGCMEIISSPFPNTSWRVPWIHTLFENTAAVACGVEAGLKVLQRRGRRDEKRVKVVAIAGDGGTADIGMQALSGVLERGHDLIYVCLDNEAYMNTGVQRSGTTPFGASTTTSPVGKKSIGQVTWKKNMPAIVAAHGIPYVATTCPSYPFDLKAKVQKAAALHGTAYLHILSVCPPGWKAPSDLGVRLGRLAVQTGIFPLYEVEDGKYKLSMDFSQLKQVTDYLKLQGRFSHLQETDIQRIQERVNKEYQELRRKAGKV